MTYDIMIKTSEQALKLCKIAEKYSFDIWVHGKSGQANAKSLLGLMLLTIENDVQLTVPDDVDTQEFEQEIMYFLVGKI